MTGPTVEINFAASSLRKCGSCSLCCSLLPVRSLGKKAGHRCRHQRFSAKGECCKVYANLLSVSPECRIWNCRWLGNDDADDLRRPDRSHYVLDIAPDYVTIEMDGERAPHEVVQIWIDPKHPDAHRDPALRAWLERRGMLGLVRYDDHRAVVLFPPSRTASGQWMEKHSDLNAEAPHSFAQVVEALAGARPP